MRDSVIARESARRSSETDAATAATGAGGSFLLERVVGPVFTRERFSDEQREIDRMVREFARDRVAPHRDDLDKLDRELTLRLLRESAELGLTGVDVPEEHGGMALDKTTSALVVEALTTGGSASWIVTFSAHVGIGTLPIVFFGTEDQKQRYLPRLATGEWLSAYALSEPGSGSDVAELDTTARPTDDGKAYLLNGTKQWVTNGGWADLYIVFASLEGAGNTAFLVERGFDGLSQAAEEHKLGIKGSSTVALNLDDVRVPKENLLGEPGSGLAIALNILNVGRFKLGAADLGGCKGLITEAVGYALERLQFGQPIAFFEAIRRKFADMVVRTFMLDSAIYRTVGMMDARISALDPAAPNHGRQVMDALEEYAIENSIAKILGSETMSKVADHGVQIYGGYGFSEEYPMARAYRDCRIDRIFEGTNEINRMVIYGYFLKKALTEQLPLRDAERTWAGEHGESDPRLPWEVQSLDVARRLIVKSLFEAISVYGQDLRNAQVLGEDLADLLIGYFAASAAVNRLLQLDEKLRQERSYQALGRLVVATFLEELHRIFYRLRPTLFSGVWGGRFEEALDRQLRQLQLPFDLAEEIHVLTDDLFDRRVYRFE
jgi:alkylation response protein AidB-like acyl-CoA dehydrogenase